MVESFLKITSKTKKQDDSGRKGYPLVKGTSSKGPFSIAMLVYRSVIMGS